MNAWVTWAKGRAAESTAMLRLYILVISAFRVINILDTKLKIVMVGEIKRQCEFALIAAEELGRALYRQDKIKRQIARSTGAGFPESYFEEQSKVWLNVQSLLIALANVSKVLWPTRQPGKRQLLRDLLQVKEDSVLKSRELRNHFEHIDERIETWYKEIDKGLVMDGGIAPSNGTTTGVKNYLRWFDTTLFAVTFRGDVYELLPLLEAARILEGSAAKLLEELLIQDAQEINEQ